MSAGAIDYSGISQYAKAGPFPGYGQGAITFLQDPSLTCGCDPWADDFGTDIENNAEQAISYLVFAVSVATFAYYVYCIFASTSGWEEMYVAAIEAFNAAIGAWPQQATPFTLYLSTGKRVQWSRYFEWLMTCPVILIHLGNLTGLQGHYSARTMSLIVSDIGCIVTGATCAFSNGWPKIIWFLVSVGFGLTTYFSAWKVYFESYYKVPEGRCRTLVKAMAITYFISWTGYPVFFAAGPEGFGGMSYYMMNILFTATDLMSKNLWGILGHTLRNEIHRKVVQEGWQLPTKGQVHNDMEESNMFMRMLAAGGTSAKITPDGRQQWVADIQNFMHNTLVLLAETHQRVKGEEPDVDSDSPDAVMAITKPDAMPANLSSEKALRQSTSVSRRKSIGDAVAAAVLTRAKSSRLSNAGDGGLGGKSQEEMLRIALGANYDKVMNFLSSDGASGGVQANHPSATATSPSGRLRITPPPTAPTRTSTSQLNSARRPSSPGWPNLPAAAEGPRVSNAGSVKWVTVPTVTDV